MTPPLSKKYPPRNRPTNQLGPIQIQIESADGILELDPNRFAMAGFKQELPLGAPHPNALSVLTGRPSYIYRTSEVEVALTSDELLRLARRELMPQEFFALAKEFGVFFEIHDDFYDEELGIALQPMSDR